MGLTLTYSLERYSADTDAEAYIRDFRRADYFLSFCQQCQNYGRRYGCPPFDYNPLSLIGDFHKVRIIGVKIIPDSKQLPLEAVNDLMEPITKDLNEELLEMEKSLNGLAFGFVGTCPYCNGLRCARIDGEPCRHPDKVRPSLEAFGFDMVKTAKDLLGLDIQWSKGDYIPEYLVLVCGVFFRNSDA